MDAFGIGAALAGAAEIYFRAAQGTGRTTALVEEVKDNDRVVFVAWQHGQHFEMLAKERGVDVHCVTVPIENIDRLFMLSPVRGDGRLLFDHMWLEAYYRRQLELAAKDIDKLQRQLSGTGAAHVETRIAAKERRRWME